VPTLGRLPVSQNHTTNTTWDKHYLGPDTVWEGTSADAHDGRSDSTVASSNRGVTGARRTVLVEGMFSGHSSFAGHHWLFKTGITEYPRVHVSDGLCAVTFPMSCQPNTPTLQYTSTLPTSLLSACRVSDVLKQVGDRK
jgi:hypothetical protein